MTYEATAPDLQAGQRHDESDGPEDHGTRATASSPSRPRLVPATTLSALRGTRRPNTAQGRSNSSVAAVRHARMAEIHAVGAQREPPRRTRRWRRSTRSSSSPIRMPTSGATASQNPNTKAISQGAGPAEAKAPERDRRPEVVETEGEPEDEKFADHGFLVRTSSGECDQRADLPRPRQRGRSPLTAV